MLPNGYLFLNRFAIRGFVGRGGFSDAYLAWDRVQDCEVVVKLMPTEGLTPHLSRFIDRETRMARLMPRTISGLVSTSDVISFQGGVCFVQERIPGESLHDRLKARKTLPLIEALNTAVILCKTLSQLHEYQIVHCDVKLHNIMISSPGSPVLIDLGTARFFGEHVSKHEIVISVPYSHEDLITGDPVDVRVDVYSLGMTLLHMLTGLGVEYSNDSTFPSEIYEQDLSDESKLDIQERHERRKQGIPSREVITDYVLRKIGEVWPTRLRAVIARSLSVEPENRYLNMDEFCNDLIAE